MLVITMILALMHVMDALVSHSCLVVDLTDGGTRFGDALKLSKMWNTASDFFEKVDNDVSVMASLPAMKLAEGAGSPHAVVGFASNGGGSMKFLETRVSRDTRKIIPEEVREVIGEEGAQNMVDAFDVLCQVGKDIVRTAVAASNMEYDAFMGQSSDDAEDLPMISGLTFDDAEIAGIADTDSEGSYTESARLSSEAATLLTEELIDDGRARADNFDQGSVSMSPHRICRYEGIENTEDKKTEKVMKEIFGAHTDTSFMTMVPVAEVSGLEVYDEDADKWFRPELLARKIWESDRERQGLDSTGQTDKVTIFEGDTEKEIDVPWHCRYVVAIPGELLQIATRNEVAAAVHRVVSVKGGSARISAPVLLRARAGMRMNLPKYFGNIETTGSLLKECNGMNVEDIHNALQPSNNQD
jgi:hypothetical protein